MSGADGANAGEAPVDFIRKIVEDDLRTGKYDGRVVTRFPPAPTGLLTIGHAKAICIDFGIAEQYGGTYHLRFDDTDPSKEKPEFIEPIQEDIRWLGFDWGENLFFASDYFDAFYEHACELVRRGRAFVCDLSQEEVREQRGTLTEPGVDSPHRERSVEQNLDLFARMRAGEFDDGARTLRAKIDMTAPNVLMRDPVFYRIHKATHHRTGDAWPIYPTYDFSHCISDSIERVTHSLCDIGFENNRPLYDWVLDALDLYHPQQIEFARLNIEYVLGGKRTIRPLVEEGLIDGWSDPRVWTLRGLRRRGYTPASIRNFIASIGVAKRDSIVSLAQLEFSVREDLNKTSPRVMAVLDPLKVVIENYPEGQTEELDAINNPEDASAGTRKVPFARELYIEREDFMEDPPRKFFRLAPGREVRLRYAYFVTCKDVVRNDAGEITELRCSYDPETRGGDAPDGRKVKGTLHWVAAPDALEAEVRLFEPLFTRPDPEADGGDFRDFLNPDSRRVLRGCKLEPSLASAAPGSRFQFERIGYFCVDTEDSTPGAPVFNRTVPLRDTWARLKKAK